MIALLGGEAKQRRDVNADSIGRNFHATQFKYNGKAITDDRSIVSGIGDLALAARGLSVPTVEQPMPACSYGCKKSCHGRKDRGRTLHRECIAKPKLHICGQKLNELSATRRINGRKQALPSIPCELAVEGFLMAVNHHPSICTLRTAPLSFTG